MPIILLIIIILIILFVLLGIKFQAKRNRERLKAATFNPAWVLILQKNLALYNKLPDTLKRKLHGLINVFVHEKTFSGYNGLQINDEIKVTIASQACMLLLNRDDDIYPSLHNIFVYPSAFKSMQTTSDGMLETIEETVRIGESWQLGRVVLSWHHSKQGAMDEADGQNVVYHEFAHQLDHEDGAIDGTPVLYSAENYEQWTQVFSQEYTRLRQKVYANKNTLIDAYGAVSEGEFFAVVTELFFERPQLLEKEHPELYEALRNFYCLNPLEWF
ncbi:MAG: zinc-dependent peptidase [Gammaproteobacteria bacterium]